MGVPAEHCHNTKQLSFQLHCQNSSSNKESNPYEKGMVSSHSECKEIQGKMVGGHIKPVSSMGTQDFVFPSSFDYSQAIARIPFQYAEPCFGGLLAAPYGPQAMIYNPQMIGMASTRVPLPDDLTEHEPIYVNAKQFRAILRRRQYRARLEAQNKLVKNRKPYLHESRHLHAIRRARGSGGRFLNTKKDQESQPTHTSQGLKGSSSVQLQLSGVVSESEVHQPENYRNGLSTASCSDVTNVCYSDGMFQLQSDFRFSGYPLHVGRTMKTHLMSMHSDGNHHV